MDNNFLQQLLFSHKVYGEIKFLIPDKNQVGYWTARSFIADNGDLKFKVSDRHGHSKIVWLNRSGELVFDRVNLPKYVKDGLADRVFTYRKSFECVKVHSYLNH